MEHGRLLQCCLECMGLKQNVNALSINFIVLHSLEAFLLIAALIKARTVLEVLKHDAEELEGMLFVTNIIIGVLLTVALLSVAFDALLIYAVRNGRVGPVLAWIIWTVIVLGLQTVAQCLETISLIALSVAHIEIVISVLILASFALEWYWVAAIISYYQLVRGQRQQFQMQRLRPDGSAEPRDSCLVAEGAVTV